MIIPEPPASVKCAACTGTPEYVWLPRMQRWVGLVPDGDGRLRVHDCRTRRRAAPPDLSDVRAAIEAASAKYRTDGKPANHLRAEAS